MTGTHNVEITWNESMQPILLKISIALGDCCAQYVLTGIRDCLVYRPGSVRYTFKTNCRSPVSDWLVDDIVFQTRGFAELAGALLLDDVSILPQTSRA